MQFCHVDRTQNEWADWLGRVADCMQRDVDLQEFADVWPTDLPPPKEISACVWREPTLPQGEQLEGEMGTTLAQLPATLRQPALAAWVSARTRGLQVAKLRCP